MDDFICQDGDLELDSLRGAQPMEAGKRVGCGRIAAGDRSDVEMFQTLHRD